MNEPRPTFVKCSGPCSRDRVDARTAREAVLIWPLNNSGQGGTHGAAGHVRTAVYLCEECWRDRIAKISPELRVLAERLGVLAQQMIHFMVPTATRQREMFEEPTERRVGA